MKNYILIVATLLFASCQDVIELDLNTSEPKLVIEATINVLKDGSSEAFVRLSETIPFYENLIPPITDAIV